MVGIDRRTMTLGVLGAIGATAASSLAAGYLALSSGDGDDAEAGGGDDAGTGDAGDDPPGPTPTPVPSCGVAPGAGTWRSYGGDAGNTGRAPASAAPSGRVDRCWTVTADAGDGWWSRPTVVDGTVYAVDPGGAVRALSADGGVERWRVEVGSTSARRRPQPTVADGTVYVVDGDGTVRALAAEDGTRRWPDGRESVPGEVRSTPTVHGDTVYVVTSRPGRLVALSADGGTVRWRDRTLDPTPGRGGPVVPVVDDRYGRRVFIGGNDRLIVRDAGSGSRTSSFYADERAGAPSVADGVGYVVTGRSRVHAFRPNGGADRWVREIDDTVPNRVAVGDQRVYVPTDGDRLYALSTDAGRTVWRYNRLDGGASAPVAADDAVYVRSEEAIHAVDADDGTRRWRAEVRGGVHSPPVVTGGGVYLAGEDALVALS